MNINQCKMLKFNISKTCIVNDYKLNNVSIESVKSFKDLGVIYALN